MRSADYMDIVKGIRVGLWNVPYVSGAYLVHGRHVPLLHRHNVYMDSVLDSDMAFCKFVRDQLIFMYVDNRVYYGHLTDSSNFETTHRHNDLYAIIDNVYTWQKKYVEPFFSDSSSARFPAALSFRCFSGPYTLKDWKAGPCVAMNV